MEGRGGEGRGGGGDEGVNRGEGGRQNASSLDVKARPPTCSNLSHAVDSLAHLKRPYTCIPYRERPYPLSEAVTLSHDWHVTSGVCANVGLHTYLERPYRCRLRRDLRYLIFAIPWLAHDCLSLRSCGGHTYLEGPYSCSFRQADGELRYREGLDGEANCRGDGRKRGGGRGGRGGRGGCERDMQGAGEGCGESSDSDSMASCILALL